MHNVRIKTSENLTNTHDRRDLSKETTVKIAIQSNDRGVCSLDLLAEWAMGREAADDQSCPHAVQSSSQSGCQNRDRASLGTVEKQHNSNVILPLVATSGFGAFFSHARASEQRD